MATLHDPYRCDDITFHTYYFIYLEPQIIGVWVFFNYYEDSPDEEYIVLELPETELIEDGSQE
jgi:hypothetical protein